MTLREIRAVYYENRKKKIEVLCEHNAEFQTYNGTCSYHSNIHSQEKSGFIRSRMFVFPVQLLNKLTDFY